MHASNTFTDSLSQQINDKTQLGNLNLFQCLWIFLGKHFTKDFISFCVILCGLSKSIVPVAWVVRL